MQNEVNFLVAPLICVVCALCSPFFADEDAGVSTPATPPAVIALPLPVRLQDTGSRVKSICALGANAAATVNSGVHLFRDLGNRTPDVLTPPSEGALIWSDSLDETLVVGVCDNIESSFVGAPAQNRIVFYSVRNGNVFQTSVTLPGISSHLADGAFIGRTEMLLVSAVSFPDFDLELYLVHIDSGVASIVTTRTISAKGLDGRIVLGGKSEIVVGDVGGNILVLDSSTLQTKKKIPMSFGQIIAMDWDRVRGRLVAISQSHLVTIVIESGLTHATEFRHAKDVAFSPSGSMVVAGYRVEIVDFESHDVKAACPENASLSYNRVELLGSGNTAILGELDGWVELLSIPEEFTRGTGEKKEAR